eukprot:TRINITY_DN792_c0_g1_i1.p1 TRINITY_DN792_c0_g1~~TRINITY_DN792_c0_g1_i1.p1  ORF type:complete len:2277 (+),score=541.08 TRINITY_DN792_c0_g1_i1:192-7022(+)
MEDNQFWVILLTFLCFGTLVSSGPCITDPDAVIQGSCSLAAAVHNYNNLVFGATANVSVVTNTNSSTGVEIRANSITVLSGALISGVGLGHPANSGIGRAIVTDGISQSPGAGHGGDGGESTDAFNTRGPAYGAVDAPVFAGSGGGSNSYRAGGAGGGAIHFVVTTNFIMNGTIDMSGLSGSGSTRDSGGGSGGSIWIEAQLFTGSGTISCNGGAGTSNSGGGSAGRIAIHSDQYTFLGMINARGGAGYVQGGRGTVYHKNRISGYTKLTVNNVAVNNRVQPAVVTNASPTVWRFDEIDLRGSGHVHFRDSDDTVIVNEQTMLGDSTSKLYTSGVINATTVSYVANFGFGTRTSGHLYLPPYVQVFAVEIELEGTMHGVDSIDFMNAAGFVVSGFGKTTNQGSGTFQFAGSVTVQGNSYVRVTPDLTNNKGAAIVCGQNFVLAPGTNISGAGYPSHSGIGAGSPTGGITQSTGAGHSGDGGRGSESVAVGAAYGVIEMPTTLGSGGGSNSYTLGGRGGTAIKLVAGNQLNIDGLIEVSGLPGSCGTRCSGGGAGGSIWLDAGTFSGTGTLRADGGSTGSDGGGGSAGRIAIYYNTYDFYGTVQGWSGAGFQHGAPATIYRKDKSQQTTELEVNNRNIVAQPAVVTNPTSTTSYQFDRIMLNSEADLQFRDTADTLTITMFQMAGDTTGQLCSYGKINASTVTLMDRFGLCTSGNGNVIFPQQVTVDAVTVTIGGSMQGVNNLNVMNAGSFEATGTGRTFGQSSGFYQFAGDVTLDGNANIILTPDTTVSPSGRGANFVCTNFYLGPGCTIKGAGRGYPAHSGPGRGNPTSGIEHSTGGGHSGYSGACSGSAAPGIAYGLLRGPVSVGSGGGSNSYRLGGAGGAAVKITASSGITIEGLIDVSGLDGSCSTRCSGGGAGGSVWLDAGGTFSGSGAIKNNGGSTGSEGGGGSAGRIAIFWGVNTYVGTIQAYAGSGYQYGGRGTIYYEDRTANFKTLLVDNNGLDGPPAIVTDPASTNYMFNKILLRGYGHILFNDTSDTVIIEQAQMDGDNTAQMCTYGLINAAAVPVVAKFGLCSLGNGQVMLPEVVSFVGTRVSIAGSISQAQTITLQNGANFELYGVGRTLGHSSGTYNWRGNLTLESNSRMTVFPDLTGTGKGISVIANQFILSDGTNISGIAFGPQSGPGAGNGGGTIHGAGAAHSGDGGRSPDRAPGVAYGVYYAPVSVGSGGGSTSYGAGGYGGAAIRLTVNTTMTINGKIDMSGTNGYCSTRCSGGGSAGSIWLDANVFDGHGLLVANGGTGGSSGGGGSAGRIACLYSTKNFVGTMRAISGTGWENGGKGTIYEQDKSAGFKRLTVDNEGLEGPFAVVTDTIPTFHQFSEVILKRKGHVHFRDVDDSLILHSEEMFGDGTSRLCSSGVINATTVDVVTNFGLCSLQNGILWLPQTTTFQNTYSFIDGILGGTQNVLLVNAAINLTPFGRTNGQSNGLYSFNDFKVTTESNITSNGDTTLNKGISIISQTMLLDSSSKIYVYGYPAGTGPGRGGDGSTGVDNQGGGGHGGRGGSPPAGGTPFGIAYGDKNQPTTLGSGGGTSAYVVGGAGGGAVKLNVSNFEFMGRIEANGGNGLSSTRDSGGGAGGSVWIYSSGCMFGSGVISAIGGNAPVYSGPSYKSGGGGGGRVRVDVALADPSRGTPTWNVNAGAGGGAVDGTLNITIAANGACAPTVTTNSQTGPLTTANGALTSGAVTSGVVTSGAVTSGAVTSGAVTSGLITTKAVTSGQITSGVAQSTTGLSGGSPPVTTNADVTTKSLTTSPITTKTLTTAPLTTNEVTTGQNTAAITSQVPTGGQTATSETTEISSSGVPVTSATSSTDEDDSGAIVDNDDTGGAVPGTGVGDSDWRLITIGLGAALGACCLGVCSIFLIMFARKNQRKKKDKHHENEDIDLEAVDLAPPSAEYKGMRKEYQEATGALVKSPSLTSSTDTNYTAVPKAVALIPEEPKKEDINKSESTVSGAWEIDFAELVLVKEVGRGNFGQVFKGKWRGGDVAVKKIQTQLSEKELSEFQGEAQLMSTLRPHTNVVQFLGASTQKSQPLCIVTEFLEGGSLSTYLQSPQGQAMGEEAMIKIARGIAAGMVHLISENIIHRDLAARNILLTSSLVPKVSDFGMSRFGKTDDVGKTGSTVGPLRWMSPESLTNGIYSEKTDVYSFGVVIYEILSHGKLPYAHLADPVQVASQVVMGKLHLEAPQNSSSLLVEVMKACLRFSPEERPAFKAVLALFPTSE